MLRIENLRKTFSGNERERITAVSDVSFKVEAGQLFTLLGPSGCGKTTTLRCIAGLEHPDSGKITIDGADVFDDTTGVLVPAYRRAIGMVFQSYAIWPHMTVRENVEFPLTVVARRHRLAAKGRTRLVNEALELMGMGAYAQRPSTALSGGQQQRLALARAIVGKPKLLLLDEPLSNLDAKLRERMRFEIKRLQTELGVTAIYVTHDQGEALALSDEIAIMRDGVIVQQGNPNDIYNQPGSDFVADFIGSANLVFGTCQVAGRVGELIEVELEGGVRASGSATCDLAEGDPVVLVVRPESVKTTPLAEGERAPEGQLIGTVRARIFLGESVDLLVETLGRELRIRVPADSAPYRPNSSVALDISSRRGLVLRDDRTLSLSNKVEDELGLATA
ncbi:MAG: spermidine/putrescine transport system ATP-binding protein [Pseudonocardiales bacterium]|jgi:iron(III) transport system ATP-binding protein|nr:spermidine/putrescine transport system ATP-binding protein [Pseudonocardiales bacterium]